MSDELSKLNEQANALRQLQAIVSRKQDRNEITEQEYFEQTNSLKEKLAVINKKIVDIMITERQKRDEDDRIKKEKLNAELLIYKEEMKLRRKKKMADEKVEKPAKAAAKKGPRKEGYASFILESLQKKSLNTVDKVVDYVMEKKPGRDRAKLRIQVVNLVKQVKSGKRPGLTLGSEDFQLTAKSKQ